ncbi:MAG TPA: GNAT family N-acetyltransferase [Candidatus Acidoferrales bacterium]|jgi:ribosomal-protein-alanine N-acetyltransferase|nr:GNAT family N-acetyltransferase [Candidatus Acidoferrales bacterium]
MTYDRSRATEESEPANLDDFFFDGDLVARNRAPHGNGRLIDVRTATTDDFEALLALFDEVAAEGAYIGTEPGFDHEHYRRNWAEVLNDPSRLLLLVAVDGHRVVGMLRTWGPSGHGISIAMLVSAADRRRGAGRALLVAATAWARWAGAPALVLSVFPHNEAAIALYRSVGFVEFERRERDVPRQNGEVWDTIHMRKEL